LATEAGAGAYLYNFDYSAGGYTYSVRTQGTSFAPASGPADAVGGQNVAGSPAEVNISASGPALYELGYFLASASSAPNAFSDDATFEDDLVASVTDLVPDHFSNIDSAQPSFEDWATSFDEHQDIVLSDELPLDDFSRTAIASAAFQSYDVDPTAEAYDEDLASAAEDETVLLLSTSDSGTPNPNAGQGTYTFGPRYIIGRAIARVFSVSALVSPGIFDVKEPAEACLLVFDFSPDLLSGEALTGVPNITYASANGLDLTPSVIANGPPSFDLQNLRVLLPVNEGIDQALYDINVVVATTNPKKTLALRGTLPVLAVGIPLNFDVKQPAEQVILAFNFSADLAQGETLTGSPVLSYATFKGADLNPTAITNGVPGFDTNSKYVLVPVMGGLDQCIYAINVICNTSNPLKVLALNGHLQVQARQ
jgi:hypothetical protein